MEAIKKPEVVLNLTTTAAFVGVSAYFYKQFINYNERLDDFESHLANNVNKVKELNRLPENIKELVSHINSLKTENSRLRETIDENENRLTYYDEVLYQLIGIIEKETGEEITLPKYQPLIVGAGEVPATQGLPARETWTSRPVTDTRHQPIQSAESRRSENRKVEPLRHQATKRHDARRDDSRRDDSRRDDARNNRHEVNRNARTSHHKQREVHRSREVSQPIEVDEFKDDLEEPEPEDQEVDDLDLQIERVRSAGR